MGSDFDDRYSCAAAERLRNQDAARQAISSAALHTGQARGLSGPVINQFTAWAVKVLRSEGVWCRDAWQLPGVGCSVTVTLNRHQSGLLGKAWAFHTPGAFLSLSKRGMLRATTIPANTERDDALYAGMAVGGKEQFQSLREQYELRDTPPSPRLFFNTEASSLNVVWASLSGAMQVKPFVDYGAEAVEALVAGWQSRKG